jgi:type I restriction enzyme S subunit
MTAEDLRKAILQQAIQGKLVPQDPNDEPASVLLERIREEKARLVKEKKIKKDKNESIIYRGEDNSHYEKFADGTVKCIDDEIPFEISESWCWERWGNLSQSIQYGYNAPALNKGDIRMVRISDIQNGEVGAY